MSIRLLPIVVTIAVMGFPLGVDAAGAGGGGGGGSGAGSGAPGGGSGAGRDNSPMNSPMHDMGSQVSEMRQRHEEARDRMRDPEATRLRDEERIRANPDVYGAHLMNDRELMHYRERYQSMGTEQDREAFRAEHKLNMDARAARMGETIEDLESAGIGDRDRLRDRDMDPDQDRDRLRENPDQDRDRDRTQDQDRLDAPE